MIKRGDTKNTVSLFLFFRKQYMAYNENLPKETIMWNDRLKQEWNANPMQVIAVTSIAATAVAKVLDSMSARKSRAAYARQINRK